ncbi:MAG: discoidin domain-containing protein [Bacteroidota bacterium]
MPVTGNLHTPLESIKQIIKALIVYLLYALSFSTLSAQLTNVDKQYEVDWTDQGLFDQLFFRNLEFDNSGVIVSPNDYTYVRNLGTASCRFYIDSGDPYPGESQRNKRAELFNKYKGDRLETGDVWELRSGKTFWMGWSEFYTAIDPQASTIFQLRSQPRGASGSPAVEIAITEKWQLELRSLSAPDGPVRDGSTIQHRVKQIIETHLRPHEWSDMIIECYLSPNSDGFIRVWRYNPHVDDPNDYGLTMNLVGEIIGPTMFVDEEYPEIRWGIYRHYATSSAGGTNLNRGYNDFGFPTSDVVEKYVGPSRFLVLNGRVTNGAQRQAAFDYVKPRGYVPDCTLPGAWHVTDIGNTQLPGKACQEEQLISLSGSGSSMGSNSDDFHFAYKEMEGDGEIIARILQLSPSNDQAAAGIMIRNSLSSDGKSISLLANPTGTYQVQTRENTGTSGTTGNGGTTNSSQPIWFRLSRRAQLISVYTSSNGVNWGLLQEVDLPMNAQVYAGLVIHSHDNTALADALFDNVHILGNPQYEASSAEEEGICFNPSTGRVVIEAENYTQIVPGSVGGEETQWEKRSYADASRGEAMYAVGEGFNSRDLTIGARLDYEVYFPQAGTYYLWARILGADPSDDSFHIGINGNSESFGGYGVTTTFPNAWIWVGTILGSRMEIQIAEPGVYTLNAWVREDGVALDKFVISPNSGYQPIGNGPSASQACLPDTSTCMDWVNLALNKPSFQSSRYNFRHSTFAVNGDPTTVDGTWNDGLYTHSDFDRYAWWEVDLEDIYQIQQINIMGRTDDHQERMRYGVVMVSTTPFTSDDVLENLTKPDVTFYLMHQEPNPWNTMDLKNVYGRYVRIQTINRNYLSLGEVQVMGCNIPQPGKANTNAGFYFSGYNSGVADANYSCNNLINISQNKASSQSSQYLSFTPSYAVNGDPSTVGGNWSNTRHYTHTNNDLHSWWEVDLGDTHVLHELNYMGRTDAVQDRLRFGVVMFSPTPFTSNDLMTNLLKEDASYVFVPEEPLPWNSISLDSILARYVRVQLIQRFPLSLAEFQVIGCASPSTNRSAASAFGPTMDSSITFSESLISIQPNPSAGIVELTIGSNKVNTFQLTLHDGMGREVSTHLLQKENSSQEVFSLDFSHLSSGLYTLSIHDGLQTYTERVLLIP